MKVVIGSRGSELALTQSRFVAAELKRVHPELDVHIEIINSRGDAVQNVPIAMIGGKGVFTKELEVALLEKRIDLAVHSLKDLPTELPQGLIIGAIPEREHPQDALVSRKYKSIDALPQGARVGTSSLRRQVQLLAYRPDLQLFDLRGNVPTRLRKLEDQHLDAIILATAGLNRLGLAENIAQILPPEIMLPAVGQGALAIEMREDDVALREILAALDHAPTRAAVTAERALLLGMGGGCQTPLAALATVENGALTLRATVSSANGAKVVRTSAVGRPEDAERVGKDAAQSLLAQGAAEFVTAEEAHHGDQPLKDRRILITRAQSQAGTLRDQLESLGARVFELPTIDIRPLKPEAPIPAPDQTDWLIFTSVNAVGCFEIALQAEGRDLEDFRACTICTIGPATAAATLERGLPITLRPVEAVSESILDAFMALDDGLEGRRILMPRGDKARPILPRAFRERGALVTELIVYETVPATVAQERINDLMKFAPEMITFTSSSTVKNFCALLTPSRLETLKRTAAMVSIGPVTSDTARAEGLEVAVEAAEYDIPSLVQAMIARFAR